MLSIFSGEIDPSIGPKAALLIAAAAEAIFAHSSSGSRSIIAQRNAASKLSPAPVTSLTDTG